MNSEPEVRRIVETPSDETRERMPKSGPELERPSSVMSLAMAIQWHQDAYYAIYSIHYGKPMVNPPDMAEMEGDHCPFAKSAHT